MKIKISLGEIKNTLSKEPILVPFWFTTDKTLHLGGDKTSMEIELDKLSLNTLREIKLGLSKGLITTDSNENIIYETIQRLTKTTEIREEKKQEAVPVSRDVQREIKYKAYLAEAEEILSKTVVEINKIIGKNKTEDNALIDNIVNPGIDDMTLLNAMLEVENRKEKKARASVINLITGRIELINKISIPINQIGLMTKSE